MFTATLIATCASHGIPTGLGIVDRILYLKPILASLRVVLVPLAIGAGYVVFRSADSTLGGLAGPDPGGRGVACDVLGAARPSGRRGYLPIPLLSPTSNSPQPDCAIAPMIRRHVAGTFAGWLRSSI